MKGVNFTTSSFIEKEKPLALFPYSYHKPLTQFYKTQFARGHLKIDIVLKIQ
jgi:hypothetical protein